MYHNVGRLPLRKVKVAFKFYYFIDSEQEYEY